ncbi:MAG: RsmB/NOP family class I SAM-dependent RNA methyltransferase [Flavobacteriales bacterium]|nr:RsmB/NOP family class I SAM-dependent RNA methyltransferase [Flavobacteriales bacterium]
MHISNASKHVIAVKHTNLHKVVIQILTETFCHNKYTDKSIEKWFRQNKKLGSRDRKFIAESTYEIIRNWRLLFASLFEENESITNEKIEKIFYFWLFQNDLIKKSNFIEASQKFSELKNIPKYQFSVPDWLYEYGCKELGQEKWNAELEKLSTPAPLVIRCNTLKCTCSELQNVLADQGIETSNMESCSEALVIKQKTNIFKLEEFKNGFFEVQDAGSQLIAPFLEVKPGMRVIDACAGAGGKTLHIAALMQNKGSIIALDVDALKLEELKKRAKRNAVFNVQQHCIENNKTIKRLENSADRLLLDVPCSGIGVLRRNPDAKWKLSEEFLINLKDKQQNILNNYAAMLKKDGKLVYSTCSIFPSENKKQVEIFLQSHPNYILEEEKMIYPSVFGFDGFYMARLLKR